MSDEIKRGWKYRAIRILLVALVVSFGVNFCYGPIWFWRNFVGWKETEVLRSLGPPFYNSRDPQLGDDKPGQPYTLGWYHGVGCRLSLHFSADGTVQSEDRDTK
jgi:hypothetical protein